MKIIFTDKFKKKFEKLPSKIQEKFGGRIDIFVKTPTNPLLKVHPLRGYLIGLRAFSVTGDYRVVYRILDKDSIKLVDIGTHAQVYRI
ncbi:type II toxin-antitoxin system RelE/ParE family toxin [Candidatus Peregrinibacteria bacterium]|nr:type II toxin-antitoxin system RelE/ParE family toxin [Candidatus Peregrinibacteria bacterium]